MRNSSEVMEQYSILGRIGEGAHGIVFKAKHIEVTLSVVLVSGCLVDIFSHVLTVKIFEFVFPFSVNQIQSPNFFPTHS